jgi:hypothetical protein
MPVFSRQCQEGSTLVSFEPESLVTASWSGRDAATLERHSRAASAYGVPPPSEMPFVCRLDPSLLAPGVERISVLGKRTSGAAEVVLLAMPDGLWVGVGSDHVDTAVEPMSLNRGKQLCRKPVTKTLWLHEEISDHWDDLILRSYIRENGQRVLYQEGRLAELLRSDELIERYLRSDGRDSDALPVGTAMFCGTLTPLGPIRTTTRFEMELIDPTAGRRLEHGYEVHALDLPC